MRIAWLASSLLTVTLLLGVGTGVAIRFSKGGPSDGPKARVASLVPGDPGVGARPFALRPTVTRTGAALPPPSQVPFSRTNSASTPAPELVFRLGWGSGPQQLGFDTPKEAAPEGPMSFSLGPDGGIWVLDQVNYRAQMVLGGRVVRSLPLINDTYQDLAVDAEGRISFVDRLVLRHVAWLGGPGQPWRFTDLEGPGVPDGGGVTALFLRDDGAWVEWAHSHLVRITDAQGMPDPRRSVRWGRFSARGDRMLRAARAGSHGAALLAMDARAVRAGVQVLARPTFRRPLAHLTALDTDPAGRVVLGAHLVERGGTAPYPVLAEEAVALVFGPDGALERRVGLQVGRGPAVPFQSLRAGPDGSIYQLVYEERGAALWRYLP